MPSISALVSLASSTCSSISRRSMSTSITVVPGVSEIMQPRMVAPASLIGANPMRK
jgi:hypothetical protein